MGVSCPHSPHDYDRPQTIGSPGRHTGRHDITIMERLQGFQHPDFQNGCCLTIGNFDGVHLGHQAILRTLRQESNRLHRPAVVLTFEPHPAVLLHPERVPPRLTTADQKAGLLEELGIDFLIEYPTDQTLLQLTALEFFQQIVIGQLHAGSLVEGPNFFFGKNRSGDIDVLRNFCQQAEITLKIVEPTRLAGDLVSSTHIRTALETGDLHLANTLLGRPYQLQGIVSPGAQRGQTLGFPTANLEQTQTLIPAPGVYAAWGHTGAGRYPAAVNIGANLTFGETHSKIEAHLLGFSGELYGRTLQLDLLAWLRDLRSFESVDELQSQIKSDVASTQLLCEMLRN